MVQNRWVVNWDSVPKADLEFVKWFSFYYLKQSTELWTALGYEIEENDEDNEGET